MENTYVQDGAQVETIKDSHLSTDYEDLFREEEKPSSAGTPERPEDGDETTTNNKDNRSLTRSATTMNPAGSRSSTPEKGPTSATHSTVPTAS